MEHYIFYCKLSLLAVLSLITACCMLSRRWYVNLAAFLACLSGETFLAYLFFPGYMLCPAAASFIILFLSRIWNLSRTPAKGNGADPIRLPVRSGIWESRLEFPLPLLQLPGLRRGRFRKDEKYRKMASERIHAAGIRRIHL